MIYDGTQSLLQAQKHWMAEHDTENKQEATRMPLAIYGALCGEIGLVHNMWRDRLTCLQKMPGRGGTIHSSDKQTGSQYIAEKPHPATESTLFSNLIAFLIGMLQSWSSIHPERGTRCLYSWQVILISKMNPTVIFEARCGGSQAAWSRQRLDVTHEVCHYSF